MLASVEGATVHNNSSAASKLDRDVPFDVRIPTTPFGNTTTVVDPALGLVGVRNPHQTFLRAAEWSLGRMAVRFK